MHARRDCTQQRHLLQNNLTIMVPLFTVQIFSYSEDMFQQPTWTWDIFSRDRDPQRFLVELLALRSPPGKPLKGQPPRAVGFKLFPGEAGFCCVSPVVCPSLRAEVMHACILPELHYIAMHQASTSILHRQSQHFAALYAQFYGHSHTAHYCTVPQSTGRPGPQALCSGAVWPTHESRRLCSGVTMPWLRTPPSCAPTRSAKTILPHTFCLQMPCIR